MRGFAPQPHELFEKSSTKTFMAHFVRFFSEHFLNNKIPFSLQAEREFCLFNGNDFIKSGNLFFRDEYFGYILRQVFWL